MCEWFNNFRKVRECVRACVRVRVCVCDSARENPSYVGTTEWEQAKNRTRMSFSRLFHSDCSELHYSKLESAGFSRSCHHETWCLWLDLCAVGLSDSSRIHTYFIRHQKYWTNQFIMITCVRGITVIDLQSRHLPSPTLITAYIVLCICIGITSLSGAQFHLAINYNLYSVTSHIFDLTNLKINY